MDYGIISYNDGFILSIHETHHPLERPKPIKSETMPVHICLLRGINVGGKRIKMDALRDMFDSLGIPNAQTLLASGNVVFQSDETDSKSFVETIEAAIQTTFGFESKIIMRTQAQLQAIIDKNPFQEGDFAGNKMLVTFLRAAPNPELVEAFKEGYTGPERIHFLDDEIFIDYVEGAGQSKLSNNLIEKKLKVVGTARNWNTVLKLQALAEKVASF